MLDVHLVLIIMSRKHFWSNGFWHEGIIEEKEGNIIINYYLKKKEERKKR